MTDAAAEKFDGPYGLRAVNANWKSLLGILPTSLVFYLAYASFSTHLSREDYTPLGYAWAVGGVALLVLSVAGIRLVDVGYKSVATSLVMLGWACSDALIGIALLSVHGIPHNASTGLTYALVTILLIHLVAIFLVWDSLTGIFGAYAKGMTVAMGSAGIVASVIIAYTVATDWIVC